MKTLFYSLLFLLWIFRAESVGAEVFHGVNGDVIPTPEEIQFQGSKGVTTVRLMIFIDPAGVNHWNEAQYFENVALWLRWFDYLIPFYREQGIKVILNMPFPPGGVNDQRLLLFKRDRHGNRHWGYQYFVNMWRYIADRYKDEPVVYAFDLINEPHNGAREVFDLQEKATAAIREVSGKLVMQTNKTGQCQNFKSIRRSRHLNIGYTCHNYVPFDLTHQGTKPGRKIGKTYPSRKYTKKQLQRALAPVAKFAKKVGAGNIYIGEGAISWYTDRTSAVNWTRDLMELTKDYNWTYFFVTGVPWRNNVWEPENQIWQQLQQGIK